MVSCFLFNFNTRLIKFGMIVDLKGEDIVDSFGDKKTIQNRVLEVRARMLVS